MAQNLSCYCRSGFVSFQNDAGVDLVRCGRLGGIAATVQRRSTRRISSSNDRTRYDYCTAGIHEDVSAVVKRGISKGGI